VETPTDSTRSGKSAPPPAVRDQQPRIEIVRPGPYEPFDATASDERNPTWWRKAQTSSWLALCPASGEARLMPTRVHSTPGGAGAGDAGFTISASACADAIVLVHGLAPANRSVPAATVAYKAGPTRPQDSVWEINLLGRVSRMHFRDAHGLPLLITSGATTNELRNWKAEAEHVAEPGSERHDWGFADSVEILWAGDLNGDHGLDILLKQGDAEIGISVEPYLSDGGPNGPHLADSFVYGAC
jgi:hypothetical protein